MATGLIAFVVCLMAATVTAQQPVLMLDSRFNSAEDVDGDGWPDGWGRVTDRVHPHYVKAAIGYHHGTELDEVREARRQASQIYLAWQQKRPPGEIIPERVPAPIDDLLESTIANRCLTIEMDGGWAEIYSPLIELDSRFVYRMTANVRTDAQDEYDLLLRLCEIVPNAPPKTLQEATCPCNQPQWKTLSIVQTIEEEQSPAMARLHFIIRPRSFRSLRGRIEIDNVMVERSPKLTVALDPSRGVIRCGDSVKLACTVTGMSEAEGHVRVQLFDVDGQIVDTRDTKILPVPAGGRPTANDQSEPNAAGYVGHCQLEFPVERPGYYRCVAESFQGSKVQFRQDVAFACLPELQATRNNKIALSLPSAGDQVPWTDIEAIAGDLRIGGLHVPIWQRTDAEAIQAMAVSLRNLESAGLKIVGVLDRPPSTVQDQFHDANRLSLAGLLEQVTIWKPLLRPIWESTCLQLEAIQIGWNHSESLGNDKRHAAAIAEIRQQTNLYGSGCKLIIPVELLQWRPSKLEPTDGADHWIIQSDTRLTAAELRSWGQKLSREQPTTVEIELPADEASLSGKVYRLAEILVALANPETPGAVCGPALSAEVVDPTGMPGELYLPLAHLADWTTEMQSVEAIVLPDGRQAVLFRQGSRDCLLCMPHLRRINGLKESLFWWGKQATVRDVWGRPLELEKGDGLYSGASKLPLTQWPILVDGVDRELIAWQNGITLAMDQLTAAAGQSATFQIDATNPTEEPAEGTIDLIADSILQEESVRLDLAVPPRGASAAKEDGLLRSDLAAGDFPVQLLVRLKRPRPLQFVIDEQLRLGLPDIIIRDQCTWDGSVLAIKISVDNTSGANTGFDMQLRLPDRPRIRFQMIDIERHKEHTVFVAMAEPMHGQRLRLSCEQLYTQLTINHYIDVPTRTLTK